MTLPEHVVNGGLVGVRALKLYTTKTRPQIRSLKPFPNTVRSSKEILIVSKLFFVVFDQLLDSCSKTSEQTKNGFHLMSLSCHKSHTVAVCGEN